MRYIKKTQLPAALQKTLGDALKNNIKWSDFSEGKAELRKCLEKEQSGLCAYSEVSLTEYDFHIEHIKPKGVSQYAHLRFDYHNLLASAPKNQGDVADPSDLFGGHKKGNRYDEQLFISPTKKDCARYFQYSPSGDIQPKNGLKAHDIDRANKTIECLGLQCQLLKTKRQKLFGIINAQLEHFINQPESLRDYLNDYFSVDSNNKLKPFQSLVKQISVGDQ